MPGRRLTRKGAKGADICGERPWGGLVGTTSGVGVSDASSDAACLRARFGLGSA